MKYLFLSTGALLLPQVASYVVNNGTDCYLYPESTVDGGEPVDDSPSIIQAFDLCGTNGSVIFPKGNTYFIDQVMNTTNLLNCDVSIQGTLEWSTNIAYWLSHSYNVSLQNQTTAWLIGGQNLTIDGSGGGELYGNGQAWYTENHNHANQPGRPISLTIFNSTNVLVQNLRIVQQQFWATFVTYSKNVTMRNIYINATSNDPENADTTNTDGFDSWNSDNILLENWDVTTGDDCVAAKGNTTNLTVRNLTCHGGAGCTIGSVGQYATMPDYVENVLFEDVRVLQAGEAAYVKTWQGVPESSTSNGDGGGGGSGYVRNVTFRNFYVENVSLPIQISQCIYSESDSDNCDTSKMQVSNITWENFNGTSRYNIASSIFCTSIHPCDNIYFKDISIQSVNETLGLPAYNTTLQDEVYQCANIVNENTTSGIPCNRWAPDSFGQFVGGNIQ